MGRIQIIISDIDRVCISVAFAITDHLTSEHHIFSRHVFKTAQVPPSPPPPGKICAISHVRERETWRDK